MNSDELKRKILEFQKNEINESLVYRKLSKKAKGPNREILEKIAEDEVRHYLMWKEFTKVEMKPSKFKAFLYSLAATIFGLTFSIKMMEGGEKEAEREYSVLQGVLPETKEILKDELEHEYSLINLIQEEKINYIGSMVLGINDAIVELTGALAGLTFALQNTRIVGLAGIITGIAAALSMAASEYLSQKSEGGEKPLKAAFYTGLAYIFAVVLLVVPYFLFSSYLTALALTLFDALIIILLFTFFIAVVKEKKFSRLFLEMSAISFGVAFISFLIGILARKFLKVGV